MFVSYVCVGMIAILNRCVARRVHLLLCVAAYDKLNELTHLLGRHTTKRKYQTNEILLPEHADIDMRTRTFSTTTTQHSNHKE
jgi:hypothetical protein